MKYISIFFLVFLGCRSVPEKERSLHTELFEVEIPCRYGGEPNLFISESGVPYISWVEYLTDSTDALAFSKMENGKWSAPLEIARGNDWFVNWADFPSLVLNGDWIAAHWLQKSAEGTYDYDVHISQSIDDGKTWQPSFIPHRDSVAAEHGFVTMFPISKDRMFAVWLDGRNTKTEQQAVDGHGHGGGAMTLRTAEFDQAGNLFEEAELDSRICDCCQTDAAMTSNGPVVVFRDRSEHEIRDISIVRKVDGEWTLPHLVHADNWEISGCPVNGPAVIADGDRLIVAWFTSANGEPMVKVAFSTNAGATFSAPLRVDDGYPLGRVDVEIFDNQNAMVTWLEKSDEEAAIKAVIVGQNGKEGESFTLVKTSPARNSGFPILAKNKDQFLLAWTNVNGDSTSVNTAFFKIQ